MRIYLFVSNFNGGKQSKRDANNRNICSAISNVIEHKIIVYIHKCNIWVLIV